MAAIACGESVARAVLNPYGYQYNTAHQRAFPSPANGANSGWNEQEAGINIYPCRV